MSKNGEEHLAEGVLDPAALTVGQLAKMLAAPEQ